MGIQLNNNSFISVWKTDNTGTSNNDQITLPLLNNSTNNFIANWGDGTSDTITAYNAAEITHTYASAGTYTVTLNGTIGAFHFNNGGDKLKILEIKQWGSSTLGATIRGFWGTRNCDITAMDRPTITGIQLERAFAQSGTDVVGGNPFRNIGTWDIKTITNINNAFQDNVSFNEPLNDWYMDNKTSLYLTFEGCERFNQPLNKWNTSNITNIRQTFENNYKFNGKVDGWDTSNVIYGYRAFLTAREFNQPLTSWRLPIFRELNHFFAGCQVFNQPVAQLAISSSCTNMQSCFQTCHKFNQPIDNWIPSNVTNTSFMFNNALVFNQPLNSWDVGSVTTMFLMFEGAVSFNQPLNNWDTSNVTNMGRVFRDATAFDQSLADWDVSNVTSMALMFSGAELSTENYDATLIGWANQDVQSNVSFHGGNSTYTGTPGNDASASRAQLINSYSWTIIDGGSA